jgi:RNA polymerase sigma-70 factor (ECF subfamily)
VRQALEYLSADQKAVVELKFFQELTFEEIAAVVQAPLSTIKSRLYAGLETLKVRLGENSLQVRRGAK